MKIINKVEQFLEEIGCFLLFDKDLSIKFTVMLSAEKNLNFYLFSNLFMLYL